MGWHGALTRIVELALEGIVGWPHRVCHSA